MIFGYYNLQFENKIFRVVQSDMIMIYNQLLQEGDLLRFIMKCFILFTRFLTQCFRTKSTIVKICELGKC